MIPRRRLIQHVLPSQAAETIAALGHDLAADTSLLLQLIQRQLLFSAPPPDPPPALGESAAEVTLLGPNPYPCPTQSPARPAANQDTFRACNIRHRPAPYPLTWLE